MYIKHFGAICSFKLTVNNSSVYNNFFSNSDSILGVNNNLHDNNCSLCAIKPLHINAFAVFGQLFTLLKTVVTIDTSNAKVKIDKTFLIPVLGQLFAL